MKMSNVQDRDSEHLIIHGDPKSGKSQLVAELALPNPMMPEGFKLIWVSMDGGHRILRKLPPEIQDRNIELIIIPDTKEFPIAVGTCLKILSGAPVSICYLHGQVDCSTCRVNKDTRCTSVHMNSVGLDTILVFDHMKQLAQSTMAFVIIDAIKDGAKDATGVKEKDADMFKPGYDQYAIQGNLMNKILGNIQVASYNVAAITHSCETKMEDGTKKLVPMVGSDPYSRNSGGFFDHVIHCGLLNKSHKFGSATTYLNGVLTGSRGDIEIEKLGEKPSLASFFKGAVAKVAKNDKQQAAVVLQNLPRTGADDKPVQQPSEPKNESVGQVNPASTPPASSARNESVVVSPAGQPVDISDAKKALLEKLKRLKGQ